MNVQETQRGFQLIEHPKYAPTNGPEDTRLVQQSSAVNTDYDDALDRPGTSYLWIGRDHHLNREQVRELIGHLQSWVISGSLE